MTYSDQLAQRKQEAADEEAELVAHFGPDANDYANWDTLRHQGKVEMLTNPAPTDTYKPKGLPSIWWTSLNSDIWYEKDAYPPSLYSDKFLFYFARQLPGDKTELIARATTLLAHADEMDCDQFTAVVDTITTYLSSPILHYINGSGDRAEFNQMNSTQKEAFFQNWPSKKESTGLFITSCGAAIANHRVIPAEVVKGKLQAIRSQIEARQHQLQAGVFIRTPNEQEGKTSLPTLALILIYEGQTVQRGEQANLLARNAGHNSGESLYQNYCHYYPYHNRIGFDNETAKRGRNMIKRIRAALPHLSQSARQKAENEIAIIEANIL
jgi:hypothetical protein